jgi:hypothetical protein
MITDKQYFDALEIVKAYHIQEKAIVDERTEKLKASKVAFVTDLQAFILDLRQKRRHIVEETVDLKPDMLLKDVNMKVRLYNFLRVYLSDFKTIRIIDLENVSLKSLRHSKNLGPKTILEFRSIFERAGITLKDPQFYIHYKV